MKLFRKKRKKINKRKALKCQRWYRSTNWPCLLSAWPSWGHPWSGNASPRGNCETWPRQTTNRVQHRFQVLKASIFSLFQLLLLWCAFFRVTPFSNPFTHLAFSYWILIVSFWLLTMRELSSWTENAKYDDQSGRGIFRSQRNNWPMKSELSASALFLNRRR